MSQKKKTESPYGTADLSDYSVKDRVSIRLADKTFYWLIKIIGTTIKFEAGDFDSFDRIESEGKTPVYATWHDRIFSSVYYLKHRGIVVLTSQSFDGEYIARFIQRFGYGAVRGSSTRGGVGALVEMIRLMRQGLPMCFTIDGPKGPRYTAKTGAVLLAKKTQNPILPFLVENKKYWTVNSWDKLQIPKPFTKAKIFAAEPIYVAKNADDAEIAGKVQELQTKMDKLVRCGENWRKAAE